MTYNRIGKKGLSQGCADIKTYLGNFLLVVNDKKRNREQDVTKLDDGVIKLALGGQLVRVLR